MAHLPSPDGLLGDVCLITGHAQPFETDGRDDLLAEYLISQATKGPLPEGESQIPGAAGGQGHDSLPDRVRELVAIARVPPGLEHGQPFPLELVDEGTDVSLSHQREMTDVLHGDPLRGGQGHLGPLPFDVVFVVTNGSA